MKKFHNRTHQLQSIEFTDGTVQYLFSGESIITSKSVKNSTSGVFESDVEKKTRKAKSSKSESGDSKEDNQNGTLTLSKDSDKE